MTNTRPSTAALMKSSLLSSAWLFLAACGGGSGDSGTGVPTSTPPPPPPPPTQVNAEGIWTGRVVVRCDIYEVRALITYEGSLFVSTPAGAYIGSVTAGPPFDVIAVNYRFEEDTPLASVAQPNAESLALTLVQAPARLHISWAAPENFCSPNGTDLRYDALYERPASLATITGVYTDGELSMAVNADGVVSGSDMNGCVLNGTVAVTHADRNYYSTNIDVDNCAASGSYAGAAFIEDAAEGGRNNVLVLAVANPDHAIWLRLNK